PERGAHRWRARRPGRDRVGLRHALRHPHRARIGAPARGPPALASPTAARLTRTRAARATPAPSQGRWPGAGPARGCVEAGPPAASGVRTSGVAWEGGAVTDPAAPSPPVPVAFDAGADARPPARPLGLAAPVGAVRAAGAPVVFGVALVGEPLAPACGPSPRTAAATSRRPCPKVESLPGGPRSLAVESKRSTVCCGVKPNERRRAAAPATCGAAMEVPAAYA